ncbi:MAG TPA: hypothetical protein DCR43_07910 [Bacteroidales bacterium]|nr:MAG: hypothetical protein A2X11_14315 [Bacteroidetes bacterium GWE2_42_24]OFY31530.1 MAG: hypothetical protein A2X09_08055 [Bacteroidetes bacterium GWF2_43_11]PKP23724.1 MAG: hypothetical protein CVU06_06790 [Bacteroidetes bacterium HGW-Bacteroidetes-22]HAQ65758.1 hypothetical protein [Bacteroidales bacterium]HBZ67221.1 hypothetical protein [Bacteroidales bacterium]
MFIKKPRKVNKKTNVGAKTVAFSPTKSLLCGKFRPTLEQKHEKLCINLFVNYWSHFDLVFM